MLSMGGTYGRGRGWPTISRWLIGHLLDWRDAGQVRGRCRRLPSVMELLQQNAHLPCVTTTRRCGGKGRGSLGLGDGRLGSFRLGGGGGLLQPTPTSNPGQSNPGQSKPIQTKPIQSKPIQTCPIQSNPIQYNISSCPLLLLHVVPTAGRAPPKVHSSSRPAAAWRFPVLACPP